jgi:hypothetical protein
MKYSLPQTASILAVIAFVLLLPFTALAAAPSLPATTALSAGYVSWWSGNGTANDSTGINNGALQGSATYADGQTGQAFSFDGGGSVSIPDSTSMHVTQFSISVWFNWNGLGTTTTQFLTGKGAEHFEIELDSTATTSNVRFIPAGYPASSIDAANVIQPGWNHIVVTYSGTVANVYMNGALVGSRTGISGGADLAADLSPFTIGRRGTGILAYNGLIENVALYNRPLGADEVRALYANWSSNNLVAAQSTDGTVALYGVVNDNGYNTTVSVEYGATTAYGSTVAATPAPVTAGSGPTMVFATLPALACGGSTYHYRIKAVNADGTTYGSDQTFTTLACQTITFGASPVLVAGGTGTVSATADSGLPVVFSSATPAVCSISGTTLYAQTAGTCTISASQAGNGVYAPASQTLDISIGPGNQNISFGPAPVIAVGGSGTVSATSTSGLAVSFSSTTSGVCTVSGATVSGVAAGTCTIVASQAGNATVPAAQARQSFAITPAGGPIIGTLKPSGLVANGAPSTVFFNYHDTQSFPTKGMLNGMVNPNGDSCEVSFDIGATTAYGTSVGYGTVSGATPVSVSALAYFSWLYESAFNPELHYRTKAVCTSSGTWYGNDVTFAPFTSTTGISGDDYINASYPTDNIGIRPTCSDDPTMANFDIWNYNAYDVTVDYTAGIGYSGNVILGSQQVQQIFVAKASIVAFSYNYSLFKQIATDDQLCSEQPSPPVSVRAFARGMSDYNQVSVLYNDNSAPITLEVTAGSDIFSVTIPARSSQLIATPLAEVQLSYNSAPFMIISPLFSFWADRYLVTAAPVSSTVATSDFLLQNNDDAAQTVVLRNGAGTEHRYTLPAYGSQTVTVEYGNWDLYLVVPGMVGPAMVGDHILVGTVYPAAPPAPIILNTPYTGLVSWWPGNGNASDFMGVSSGTLNGAATYAAGHSGQAFSFGGATGDYLSIPDADPFHTSQFSISAWFNWNDLGSATTQFLMGKGVEHFEIELDSTATTSNVRFIPAGYPASSLDAANAIQPGWNHIVVTYSGTVANVYLNGTLAGSRSGISGGADLAADLSPFTIGRRGTGILAYNGLIDDVALYNRVLDATEVSALYNAGTVRSAVIAGSSGTTATLYATVNDNGTDTTASFEYGATAAYGGTGSPVSASPSPVSGGSGATLVSAALSGLSCGTTYHYRLHAVNSNGTTNGSDQTFTTLQCQTISFTAIPAIVTGTSATASATATSGLPVVFSSLTPLTCSVSGATVTGLATGGCTIAVDQPGNSVYTAAPMVTQSFTIGKGHHDLAFGPAPAIVVGGTGTVSAGDASGATVLFSSLTPAVCTVSGAIVTGAAAGLCTIAANLPGDSNYYAAGQVTQSFTITPAGGPIIGTLKPSGLVANGEPVNVLYNSNTRQSFPTKGMLNGLVNPNGDSCEVSFEYGPTTAYGTSVGYGTVSGAAPVAVSTWGVNFSWIHDYFYNPELHYRTKAVCATSGTWYGNDITFVPFTSTVRWLTNQGGPEPVNASFPTLNIHVFATCSDSPTWAVYNIVSSAGYNVTVDYSAGGAYLGSASIGDWQTQWIPVDKAAGIASFSYHGTLFNQTVINEQSCSETPSPPVKIRAYALGLADTKAASGSEIFAIYNDNPAPVTLEVMAFADVFNVTIPARSGQLIATGEAEAQLSYNAAPFQVISPLSIFWADRYLVTAAPVSSTVATSDFLLQNNDDAAHTVVLRNGAGTEHRYTLPAYVAQQVTVPYDTWGLYLVIPGMVGPKMVGDHVKVGTLNPGPYSQSINFGAAPVIAVGGTGTVSASGGASGNPVTFSSLTTDVCTVSGANGATVTAVSVGTCTIAAGQAGNGSYAPAAQVTQSFTVGKGTPNVSDWPTASAITYGQTLASSALSGGTASKAGAFAFTTPAAAPGAGSASQGVTFTPTDTANYNSVTGTVSVTVNKAASNVTTWPTASAITYGQTLASSNLTGGSATPAGTFAFTTSSTVPGLGTASQGVTFTPTDTANFNSATGTASVTVNKATPNVSTWPAASAITYGQTLASSNLTGGSVTPGGTFAFTTPTTAPNAGSASYGVTFTPTDTTNYNSATGTASVTVNKATPNVSTWPTASAITYGQTLASSNLTGGSVTPGGTFAFTTPTTAPNAGSASYSVTFTPIDTANYNNVTGTVSVTVNRAASNVTIWPVASAITYGQTLAASNLTGGSAAPAGTFTFATPTIAPNAGTASYGVTFTPADSINYNSVTGTASVTVDKATPNVSTWPTAGAITYGQTLAASNLTSGSAVPAGTFAFTTPTTAPNAGTASYSVTFTPTDTANYNSATGTASVTVDKATPNVTTWPTAGAITYGQTLAASNLTGGSAAPAGTFAFTTLTTAPNVGTGSQSVTFTPTDTANYNSITGAASVTVAKAPQTIILAATATKTYGNADFGLGATISTGLSLNYASSNTNVATVSSAGIVHIVAAGSATITASQAGDGNYLAAGAEQTLTVNKATLTVTADNKSRAYGAADPAFTATYSGFVNAEESTVLSGTPVFSSSADSSSPEGSYPITAAPGTLMATNYNFTFARGTLAVGLASQSITFNALSAKTYGDASFDLAATGGPSANPVIFSSSNEAVALISGTTVTIKGAGSAVITANQAGITGEYASATAQQLLTVNKRGITVTTVGKERSYNTPNPAFTATYSGFAYGEDATVISGAPLFTTTATQSSPTGSYPISIDLSGLSAANYSFTGVNGILAVDVAGQNIDFGALATKTYGDGPFELNATGGASGNPVTFTSSNEAVATISGGAVTIRGAGSAVITASQAGSSNYAPATAQQTLTVNKALLTVTADNKSRAYGEANPVFTASYSGFVNNEDAAVVQGSPSLAASADAASAAGSYPITAAVGNLFSNNYSFSYVNGTLTIGKAPATVALGSLNQTYDGTAKTVTAVTTPAGLAMNIIYNGSPAPPVNAGSYTVVATINDSNYQGAATGTLVIADTTPPTLTIRALADNSFTNNANFDIAGTVSDAGGVRGLTVNGQPVVVAADGTFATVVTLANGANTITAIATDTAGNTTADSRTITLDVTAPTLTVSTLADKAVTNLSPLNIAGSVADVVGIASLTVNGLPVTIAANGSYSSALPLTTQGETAITVIAIDRAGNIVSDSRTINYDSTLPAITVTNPADNSQTRESALAVSGTVSESGDVTVRNATTNSLQPAALSGTAFSAVIQLVSGSNTIEITAADPAGNKSATIKRTIIYDPDSPALAITSPPHDSQLHSAAVTIQGTVSDATTTSVTLTFNGANYPQTVTAGQFQQELVIPAEGVYQVTVTASDAVGNPPVTVSRNIIFTPYPGDSNGDGATAALVEVLKAFQYVIGQAELTPTERLRLDCAPLGSDGRPDPDGAVTMADVILLLRRSVGLVSW